MAALQDSNEAIRLDDSDVDAYRTRAAAYVKLQQYELAKVDLDRVLRANKMDAEAYRLRGSALVGLNRVRRALTDFSTSIAQDPLSAEAYYQRCWQTADWTGPQTRMPTWKKRFNSIPRSNGGTNRVQRNGPR